jgi:hypothetical protein
VAADLGKPILARGIAGLSDDVIFIFSLRTVDVELRSMMGSSRLASDGDMAMCWSADSEET